MDGKVGKCVEVVDVERVLPIGTSQEKRLRLLRLAPALLVLLAQLQNLRNLAAAELFNRK
jgi:hypothetical protein